MQTRQAKATVVGILSDTHGLLRAEALHALAGTELIHLNPGSAGPRRFRLPTCVARVRIAGKRIEPEIVTL